MKAGSHLIFGAACYSAAHIYYTGDVPAITALGTAMIGALLPDIDHPKSFLGRKIVFISKPLSNLIGHRGLTHSLIIVAAICWAIYQLFYQLPPLATAVMIGYLSHIVGDYMTRSGVPLFWPYKKRFAMPFAFPTGGRIEYILTTLMMLWLIWIFNPPVKQLLTSSTHQLDVRHIISSAQQSVMQIF